MKELKLLELQNTTVELETENDVRLYFGKFLIIKTISVDLRWMGQQSPAKPAELPVRKCLTDTMRKC